MPAKAPRPFCFVLFPEDVYDFDWQAKVPARKEVDGFRFAVKGEYVINGHGRIRKALSDSQFADIPRIILRDREVKHGVR